MHKNKQIITIRDQVDIEIVPKDFGRIAAQTAKQVIIQKLREVERDLIFNEFNDRKGEIVSGIIQKADKKHSCYGLRQTRRRNANKGTSTNRTLSCK